ncbi:uncharacterized protein CCOS01_16062 [Colletotrichum costaricense]|uniref:Uncharacterized protein n=1 Tax=Colletotrichum costaricense TaxID=1209916 RepID=A0AAJ0DSP3_9PEZI|nr:uncharacterized protein CCOS01_16062 [Colletotrichum costaricense]KAK1508061.1 hypothetical protein CCOS01_16062 [Colletotrichum costaricense]
MLVRSQTLQLSSSTPGAAHHMLMFTPDAPCSLGDWSQHGGSHGSSTSGMAPCRRRDPQMGRVPLLLVLVLVLVLLECERGTYLPSRTGGKDTPELRQTPDSPETHSSQPAPSIPSVSTGTGTLGTGDWDCDYDCDQGCVVCGIANCVDGGGRGGWGDDDTYRQKPIPATIHNP